MSGDLTTMSRRYLEVAIMTFEHSLDGKHVWLTPDERGGVSVQDLSPFLPAIYAGSFPATLQEIEHELAIRPSREFKHQHDITDAEFATPHWQTLFAIQYPEARS